MSIESIIKRIEGETRAYVDANKEAAEIQNEALLKDARIEADQVKSEIIERAERDSKVLLERKESVAGLDARKMQLAAKQEVISECFDKALEKLLALPEEEYIQLLVKQLGTFKGADGEVLLNAEDTARYGGRLAKECEKLGLKLGEGTVDIRGGFILKQGDVSINSSLERLLDDLKNEMTADVARKLF